MKTGLVILLIGICTGTALGQISSIVNSPHNLSAAGPGTVRARSEQEICIFCHTPHNAAPIQPLWNRNVPLNAYTVYSSPSLKAAPGQPTGTSKLCLSCHDGTIAVGSVLSRGQPIAMSGGITTLPPGASNLGTDLSDDHPISFRYDSALTARNLKLKQPTQLPPSIHLDSRQEMQCTSCHDAHNNTYGSFLVMDNSNSQLCNSCHQQGTTTVVNHTQCNACHTPHTAPSKTYLLKGTTVTGTCLACHNGAPGPNQGANVGADINKISPHDTHTDMTLLHHLPNNITCTDCHEGHTMKSQTAAAPAVSPKLGDIGGINLAGAPVPKAQFEYEVCFKCHNDQQAVQSRISRVITQINTRLEFAPSAVSYHPVAAAGRNTDVPSLRPPLTTASIIRCTDCHASDTSKAAGSTGANGPHGSNASPLLLARYETRDYTPESSSSYALCYRCHDRNSILGDQSFKQHKKHIVGTSAPCSACHDSHGISSTQGSTLHNSKLINFDISIVRPASGKTQPQFTVRGYRSGSCSLTCHGKTHNDLSYNP
ncbi:MAG: cytochrome c3 family protein [Bacillota bacterium]